MPKKLKMKLPATPKASGRRSTSPTRARAVLAWAVRGWLPVERQEDGDGRERVDDREDRSERDEGVGDQGRHRRGPMLACAPPCAPRRSSKGWSSASPSRAPSRASASSSWPSQGRSRAARRRRDVPADAPRGARSACAGSIEVDKKHGEQLRVESLIELAPDTLAGLEKYLASGLIKGVGPKMAQRIVATFGLGLAAGARRGAAPPRRGRGARREAAHGARQGVAGAARAARRDGLPAGARREPGARDAHRAPLRRRTR